MVFAVLACFVLFIKIASDWLSMDLKALAAQIRESPSKEWEGVVAGGRREVVSKGAGGVRRRMSAVLGWVFTWLSTNHWKQSSKINIP